MTIVGTHAHLPELQPPSDVPASGPQPPLQGRPLHRSKQLLTLVILLPAVVLAFIAILLVQHRENVALAQENAEVLARNSELEVQNAFYKKAYEITLDDIKLLSSSYGGEARYERLASDLREKELGTVLGEQTANKTYRLRNPFLWREYQQKGIISTSCLAAPVTIDTIADEVLLTLRGNASNLSVYIDGNYLTALALSGEASLNALIPSGTHELDLVLSVPGTVTGMLLDTVPFGNATTEYGAGWEVFDCVDTAAGGAPQRPGAVRVLFTKS